MPPPPDDALTTPPASPIENHENDPVVVILCGGQGTRLREHTAHMPKPMVRIGDEPILAHIMRHYAHHGFDRFVLCLGHKGQQITDWLASPEGQRVCGAWDVAAVDTGIPAGTGARIAKVADHLDGERFMVTYGDGLSDVDLRAVLQAHRAHGRLATVTGVNPPPRFGQLVLDDDDGVRVFSEKPQQTDTWINGGFFVFERAVLQYLSTDDDCLLERGPLDRLAQLGQLSAVRHTGFWQCMDTHRDWALLTRMWTEGDPPWKTWAPR